MRRIIALVLLAAAATRADTAELVLHNGLLWTGDPARPAATALAIDQGRIIAVGDDASILALARAGTRRIDLKSRRVIPGINDAHVHLGAWWSSTYLSLASPDPSRGELEAALHALPANGSGWISATIGGQLFNDPEFDIGELDALVPARPLILQSMTGHGTLVNSLAKARLGIDPAQSIPGGWFGKDRHGAFDGRLYEYAQWKVRAQQPALADEAEIAELRAYSEEILKYGTTSVQAMSLLPPARLASLWQRSQAPQRLRLIHFPVPDRLDAPVASAGDDRDATARVRIHGTKWILDGTPIEFGAATRTPYPQTGGQGVLNFQPDQVRQLLAEIIARQDQPLLHVTGDRTAEVVLDAMAGLGSAADWQRRRLRMEHGDGLRAELLARAREYGVVVVQNPSHFLVPDPYMGGAPLKAVLEAGIALALGSDGPANPWLNMMWALQTPAAPGQALGREQVLQAYTGGSAWAEFAENEKGRLAPGLVADLAVLSQDVLDPALPEQALPATTSVLTVIDGQVAWQDPAW
jgi:predicted amidohydrolase YtcJ